VSPFFKQVAVLNLLQSHKERFDGKKEAIRNSEQKEREEGIRI
jgi:hypothetical protein